MGGCLACGIKREPISLSDEQPKGLVTQQPAKDVASAYDMDSIVLHSQGSILSKSTSVQTLDPHPGVGSGTAPSEFVNHGLLLWNQTREQWVGDKKSHNGGQKVQESKLSWNTTYDSLLGSNKPFPQPIPLDDMVDFLVDLWEQEGMHN